MPFIGLEPFDAFGALSPCFTGAFWIWYTRPKGERDSIISGSLFFLLNSINIDYICIIKIIISLLNNEILFIQLLFQLFIEGLLHKSLNHTSSSSLVPCPIQNHELFKQKQHFLAPWPSKISYKPNKMKTLKIMNYIIKNGKFFVLGPLRRHSKK